jgi:hypothetical protein
MTILLIFRYIVRGGQPDGSNCSETQYDRGVRPTYLRNLYSLHYSKSWNSTGLKYPRFRNLFQCSLPSWDLELQFWLDCTYTFRKSNPFENRQHCLKRRPREVYEKLASLGLRLRQHCQFLTLDIFVKNTFWEVINKNKWDCHQCRIISLITVALLEHPFRTSLDDVSNKPYRVVIW